MRLTLIAAVVLVLVHAMVAPSTAEPLSPERVLGAQMRLAARLAAELEKQPRENPNIVISPASVAGVMALLDIGADVKMRGAIWDMLGFKPALGHDAASDLKALRATITLAPQNQKPDDAAFNLANVVMFDPAARPYPKAMDEMRATGAEVSVAPLENVANIRRINEWVAEENAEPDPRHSRRAAVAARSRRGERALLQGPLAHAFPERPDQTAAVSHDRARRRSADDACRGFLTASSATANSRRVEMPYRGGRYSLVVLANTTRSLPFKDFFAVTGWLDGAAFTQKEVRLSFPRFTLEAGEELLDPLKAIGLKNGTDSVTAFEGLSALPPEISRVVQKTYMKVDEEGTEAAAATSVIALTAAMPRRDEPETLVLDRPFIFALKDRQSGLILMSGYIERPATGPAADLGATHKFASETIR